jgi:hypothetical protein
LILNAYSRNVVSYGNQTPRSIGHHKETRREEHRSAKRQREERDRTHQQENERTRYRQHGSTSSRAQQIDDDREELDRETRSRTPPQDRMTKRAAQPAKVYCSLCRAACAGFSDTRLIGTGRKAQVACKDVDACDARRAEWLRETHANTRRMLWLLGFDGIQQQGIAMEPPPTTGPNADVERGELPLTSSPK